MEQDVAFSSMQKFINIFRLFSSGEDFSLSKRDLYWPSLVSGDFVVSTDLEWIGLATFVFLIAMFLRSSTVFNDLSITLLYFLSPAFVVALT